MFLLSLPNMPPPLPPIGGTELDMARYQQAYCPKFLTVDEVWLLREEEQNWRNKQRREDWETRFKVLGPRPEDAWR